MIPACPLDHCESTGQPPSFAFKTPSQGTVNLALAAQTMQDNGAAGHLPAPFHRIGEDPPYAEGPMHGAGDEGTDDDSDDTWHPTFLVYAMHTTPEEVRVALRAPCGLETARGAVLAAMSEVRSRYYPHILFADPQPTQYWGAAISLPL